MHESINEPLYSIKIPIIVMLVLTLLAIIASVVNMITIDAFSSNSLVEVIASTTDGHNCNMKNLPDVDLKIKIDGRRKHISISNKDDIEKLSTQYVDKINIDEYRCC